MKRVAMVCLFSLGASLPASAADICRRVAIQEVRDPFRDETELRIEGVRYALEMSAAGAHLKMSFENVSAQDFDRGAPMHWLLQDGTRLTLYSERVADRSFGTVTLAFPLSHEVVHAVAQSAPELGAHAMDDEVRWNFTRRRARQIQRDFACLANRWGSLAP